MRGHIDGLPTPASLAHALPAVFQDDDFTMRFVRAFDDVLAPLFLTLDTVDAYLDPALTPVDFLPWLGGWVGLDLDENWSDEQARRLVSSATSLFAWQGTVAGVEALVMAWTGLSADALEITDSGGTSWSPAPLSEPPGHEVPELVVRLHIAPDEQPDVARLRRFVAQTSPAQVRVRVELLTE